MLHSLKSDITSVLIITGENKNILSVIVTHNFHIVLEGIFRGRCIWCIISFFLMNQEKLKSLVRENDVSERFRSLNRLDFMI